MPYVSIPPVDPEMVIDAFDKDVGSLRGRRSIHYSHHSHCTTQAACRCAFLISPMPVAPIVPVDPEAALRVFDKDVGSLGGRRSIHHGYYSHCITQASCWCALISPLPSLPRSQATRLPVIVPLDL